MHVIHEIPQGNTRDIQHFCQTVHRRPAKLSIGLPTAARAEYSLIQSCHPCETRRGYPDLICKMVNAQPNVFLLHMSFLKWQI